MEKGIESPHQTRAMTDTAASLAQDTAGGATVSGAIEETHMR